MEVHLAGTVVGLAGRVIQRCLICGEKLLDSKGSSAPVDMDGKTPTFPTWPVGGWVEVDGNQSMLISETKNLRFEAGDIPDGCCKPEAQRWSNSGY